MQTRIFKRHFLEGLDWRQSCGSLGRGDFFHAVYTIEQDLGRAYLESRPYSVWPVAAYFGGLRRGRVKAIATRDVLRLRVFDGPAKRIFAIDQWRARGLERRQAACATQTRAA